MCIRDSVETVKGYAKYESETLEQVIQARNRAMKAVSYTHLDVYKRQHEKIVKE